MKLKKLKKDNIECIGCGLSSPSYSFQRDGNTFYLCDDAVDAAIIDYIDSTK